MGNSKVEYYLNKLKPGTVLVLNINKGSLYYVPLIKYVPKSSPGARRYFVNNAVITVKSASESPPDSYGIDTIDIFFDDKIFPEIGLSVFENGSIVILPPYARIWRNLSKAYEF